MLVSVLYRRLQASKVYAAHELVTLLVYSCNGKDVHVEGHGPGVRVMSRETRLDDYLDKLYESAPGHCGTSGKVTGGAFSKCRIIG